MDGNAYHSGSTLLDTYSREDGVRIPLGGEESLSRGAVEGGDVGEGFMWEKWQSGRLVERL